MRKVTNLLVLLCLSAMTAGAGIENCLPPDTILYTTINDVPKAKAEIKRWPAYRFLTEGAVGEIITTVAPQRRRQISAAFKQNLGFSWRALLAEFKGEIALALTHITLPTQKTPPDIGLLIACKMPNGEMLESLVTKLLSKQGPPPIRQVSPFLGFQVVSLKSRQVEVLLCRHEDRQLLSLSRSTLERALAALGAAAPPAASLSTHPGWKKCLEVTAGAKTDGIFYLNTEPLFALVMNFLPPPQLEVLQRSGLMDLKQIGASFRLQKGQDEISICLNTPGTRQGIFGIKGNGPLTGSLLPSVPKGCVTFFTANLDPRSCYDGVRNLVQTLNSGQYRQIRERVQNFEKHTGLSVRKDLLDPALGEYGCYAIYPPSGGLLPATVMLAKVKDVPALSSALEKFQLSRGMEKRSLNCSGRPVTYFLAPLGRKKDLLLNFNPARWQQDLPKFLEILGTTQNPAKALTCSQDLLITAYGVHDLRLALAQFPPAASLADDPVFSGTRALLPADPNFLLFDRNHTMLSESYCTLLPLLNNFLETPLRSLGIPLDTALLPEPEKLSRGLAPFALAGYDRQDHYLLVLHAPFTSTMVAVPMAVVGGITAAVAIPALLKSRKASREASLRASRPAKRIPPPPPSAIQR